MVGLHTLFITIERSTLDIAAMGGGGELLQLEFE